MSEIRKKAIDEGMKEWMNCNTSAEDTQQAIERAVQFVIDYYENLTKHNNDFKTKLEKIYTACNDERVFEIQNRIGDLLKEISS